MIEEQLRQEFETWVKTLRWTDGPNLTHLEDGYQDDFVDCLWIGFVGRASLQPEDYFGSLVFRARLAADKAMVKFPQPNYVLTKVSEESGEVIKAGVHYAEGRDTWEHVEAEIIDNLAMLIRLVVEGDHVIGLYPPIEVTGYTQEGDKE